jgi:hypothetical protein
MMVIIIATGWTIEVRVTGEGETFFFVTKSPIQWVPGFPRRVKRQEPEADNLIPSRAEIKNVWTFISTPTYFYMA